MIVPLILAAYVAQVAAIPAVCTTGIEFETMHGVHRYVADGGCFGSTMYKLFNTKTENSILPPYIAFNAPNKRFETDWENPCLDESPTKMDMTREYMYTAGTFSKPPKGIYKSTQMKGTAETDPLSRIACFVPTDEDLEEEAKAEAKALADAETVLIPIVDCTSQVVNITFTLPMESKYYPEEIFAGDHDTADECKPKVVGRELYFSFPIKHCDPKVHVGLNFISYTYLFGNSSDLVQDHVITRDHNLILSAKCNFTRMSSVQATFVGNVSTVFVQGSDGVQFEYAMNLYHDKDMMEKYDMGSSILVGTEMYAMVEMNTAADVMMRIQKCYASPEANSTELTYEFIHDKGCIGDDETFSVVKSSVTDKSYGFGFEAFAFTEVETPDVYLTCEVLACPTGYDDDVRCVQPREC